MATFFIWAVSWNVFKTVVRSGKQLEVFSKPCMNYYFCVTLWKNKIVSYYCKPEGEPDSYWVKPLTGVDDLRYKHGSEHVNVMPPEWVHVWVGLVIRESWHVNYILRDCAFIHLTQLRSGKTPTLLIRQLTSSRVSILANRSTASDGIAMDPDQQLRNVSQISHSVAATLSLFCKWTRVWWGVWVTVSLAAAGFPSGLQPHDWSLLPAMHQQLQLQKPHHGRGTRCGINMSTIRVDSLHMHTAGIQAAALILIVLPRCLSDHLFFTCCFSAHTLRVQKYTDTRAVHPNMELRNVSFWNHWHEYAARPPLFWEGFPKEFGTCQQGFDPI